MISCWLHRLRRVPHTKSYRYTDQLSRFGGNASGTNLLRDHLVEAQAKGAEFRLIVARVLDESDVERIERGEGADKVKKTFAAKPEFTGRLESFEGDEFEIIFNAY